MLITVQRTNLLTASSITLVLIGLLQPALAPVAWAGDASAELKSIRKTCGKCPDGYATTGVTEAPELCKGGDPTLTQCVPRTEDGLRSVNWRPWNNISPIRRRVAKSALRIAAARRLPGEARSHLHLNTSRRLIHRIKIDLEIRGL